MSTFKKKNSLRTIKAQIVQKLKNNEARPKFTGSYKKKACMWIISLKCLYFKMPNRILVSTKGSNNT